MRELRPLILPELVASPTSPAAAAEDIMTAPPAVGTNCSSESLAGGASECSTPLTPAFSTRSTVPATSSTSSLTSTPTTTYDALDATTATGKLPDLVEEPMEREDGFVMVGEGMALSPCLCDDDGCPHQNNPFARSPMVSSIPELERSSVDDCECPFRDPSKKRRRSGDSNTSGLATRFSNRFPSLSRRFTERRNTSTTSQTRSVTPSQTPSSRSSSLTGNVFPVLDQSGAGLPPTPARSSTETQEEFAVSPIDMLNPTSAGEPIDRAALTSTPLLPPLMTDGRANKDAMVQSPLQSPTIASPNPFSIASSPTIGTPQAPGIPSPPLSTKPSISSFHRSFSGHMIPASDIPPLPLHDPNDAWAIKLGHANFTIHPEPYIPDLCDADGCRALFARWEHARRNYVKHLVRTGEHFGVTSRTYQLTEAKWAETDAEWRTAYDVVVATAASRGEASSSFAPAAPAPLAAMPTLHGPEDEGKFPKLGDEDIVGPMVQLASHLPCKPSRKGSFLRFLGDMKFPGSFLGRGSAGIRA